MGEIESIKLYKNTEFVAETDIDDLRFAELDSYQSYTITVEVTYDLNDGIGNRSKTFDYAFKTHPYFAFIDTEVLNTSAVSLGRKLYCKPTSLTPDGAKYTEVKINGRWYTVSTASTDDKRLRINYRNRGKRAEGTLLSSWRKSNFLLTVIAIV